MFNTERAGKILGGLLLSSLAMLSQSPDCSAQSSQGPPRQAVVEKAAGVVNPSVASRNSLANYKGQNGILSMKTLVLGGEFRVTTVIPFKGNFAEYHHLESQDRSASSARR